jgi:ATPase subunit of ABC transporter with duplicated ATPase domains
MTEKILTAEEKWDICDWTKKDSIVTLFPDYVQEQVKVAKQKNVSKAVNIEYFNMKTPYGDQHLLKDTSLVLEANKRQALIGNNSTGKTLLFHNMSEYKIKDFPRHIHVHHCKELEGDELKDTVVNTVVNSHPYRNILIRVEPKIKEQLEKPDLTADAKDALKTNLEWVQSQMRSISGYDAKDRAEKMLRVLGFDEYGQAKLVSALSGGLRMRVALCMAFFINAELLLLDEPTNHLDFPSVLWLENRLRGYRGAFLMVSHDRELLNNVCTSILLIEDKKINYYACGFKEFEKKKAAEDKKKFDEIEKFLHKNQNVDPSTFLGRQKQDKKEWSENYYQRQIAMAGKFTFPTAVPLENTQKNEDGTPVATEEISLINLKDVRFTYDNTVDKPVFIFNDPVSFNVKASTRCGVMGPNGAGKSTLLKLLTHKLPATAGTVTHHPKYTLAYFGQHSTAELDPELTPAEFMLKQFPDETAGTLRNHLQKTGIVGNTADTRMKQLSYSQKSCIVFAKLTFVCPHLLILDEPTNFLDLASVDSLIAACNKYKGALLLVSHNRDFLKKCATSYLSVVPGHFDFYTELKAAEQGTYSFIAEMEEGNSGAGKSALANNPGGGSVHASQVAGGAIEKKDNGGDKVLSISSSSAAKPAAKKVAAPVVTYAVNEKIQALWTDGKWYAGVVKKAADAKGNYSVLYTAYGNTALLAPASIKKAEAAPAKAAPAAAGAAPAAAKKTAAK